TVHLRRLDENVRSVGRDRNAAQKLDLEQVFGCDRRRHCGRSTADDKTASRQKFTRDVHKWRFGARFALPRALERSKRFLFFFEEGRLDETAAPAPAQHV